MARKKQNLEKYKVVHVIQRTELKTPWFKDQNICEKRIYLFKRACIEEGITILAFSVLPTHTHDILVFEGNIKKLSRIYQRVNGGLAAYLVLNNETHNVTKNNNSFVLFSSRPRYFPIQNTEELFILTKYIYDNPLKHKCSKTALDYPWSSFKDLEKEDFCRPYSFGLFKLYYQMNPTSLLKLMCYGINRYKEVISDLTSKLNTEIEKKKYFTDF